MRPVNHKLRDDLVFGGGKPPMILLDWYWYDILSFTAELRSKIIITYRLCVSTLLDLSGLLQFFFFFKKKND